MILTGIGVLVLLGLGGWYFMNTNAQAPTPTTNTVTQQPPQPRVVTHSLSLAQRKLTPDIVTVTQGDQVTIKVMSDEKGEFHVSGYEIENFMGTPGQQLEFSFAADKLGRYNLEWHPGNTAEEAAAAEDLVIGALVVNPR